LPLACIENFFRCNDEHPAFSSVLLGHPSWMPLSHEILSFPEFFMHRFLANCVERFEQFGLAESIPESLIGTSVLSSKQYRRLILRHNDRRLDADLALTQEYLELVERRLNAKLTRSPAFHGGIGRRIISTITWYTREAFRYGTQSRVSMLYERLEIDRFVESVVVAMVVAAHLGDRAAIARLSTLTQGLRSLVEIHERHGQTYVETPSSFSAARYETDLAELREGLGIGWS
jgi:hypothetical protein